MCDLCDHEQADHRPATICEEVIHYPSEDYPCLCERLLVDEGGKSCLGCGHGASRHSVSWSCYHASGDPCPCRTVSARAM